MSAAVAIQTRRLVLRRFTREDAKDIFDGYARDPEVTRFLTWSAHRSLDDTYAFLDDAERQWDARSGFSWAIVLAATRAIIGSIGVRVSGHRGEFGYALARAAWGQGYATEAVRAVVTCALSAPGMCRMQAYVDTANVPSQRVLEKAGLTREGCLRKWYVPSGFGVPRDAFLYAQIKESV